jgi:hypothetical protein
LFPLSKSDNRRVKELLPVRGEIGNDAKGKEVREALRRVQIPCTHVCKWKNDTC